MLLTEVDQLIEEATAEVLESMCFMEVVGESSGSFDPGLEWLAATLHFEGPFSGELGVGAPPSTVTTLAASFLGEDPSELEPSQKLEFLGELSNMICGALLGRRSEDGIYKLSHPVSTSCSPDLKLNCTLRRLQLDEGELVVWLSAEKMS